MVVDFRSHLLNFDYRPTITKWGSHTATQEDNPSQRQLSLQKQLTGFWNKPVNAFLTQINDNILSLWKKHPVVSSATTLLRNTLLEKKLPFLYHREISCWLLNRLHKNFLRCYIETKTEKLSLPHGIFPPKPSRNALQEITFCTESVWSNSQKISEKRQLMLVMKTWRYTILAYFLLLLPNSFNMRTAEHIFLLFEMTSIGDIYDISFCYLRWLA